MKGFVLWGESICVEIRDLGQNQEKAPFSRDRRMVKKTVRCGLLPISGSLLCKPLLGGIFFKILRGTMEVGLTVVLKPRGARRCSVELISRTLFSDTKYVHVVRHAKKTVECPWCTSVNHYVYVWGTLIRCERCLPIPMYETPELAAELNLIPQYDWIPIPPGHVHSAGIIFTDGQIYAAQ